MKVFRCWYVKTIAAYGKSPVAVNEVLKTCPLVGCQSMQDANSAVSLPCRCLIDECSTWATVFLHPSHLKDISLNHCYCLFVSYKKRLCCFLYKWCNNCRFKKEVTVNT